MRRLALALVLLLACARVLREAIMSPIEAPLMRPKGARRTRWEST